MMRAVGLCWTVVLPSIQWPRIHQGSFFEDQSIEWPGQGHAGYNWLWRIILSTLGLHYHKGSGGRVVRLQWRSSGPSHTRFNCLWILSASYSGYTYHQLNHEHDQREWNRWVAGFLEWVKNILLLACCWKELSVRSEAVANQTVDLTNLNKAVKMIKREEIDAFSSKIIHDQTKNMLLGNNLHVMMQTLKGGDGPCLPHGLSVINTYTKVMTRSKWVAVMVKNLTATPITIAKGVKVTQIVAVNVVPQVEVGPGTLENLDEM